MAMIAFAIDVAIIDVAAAFVGIVAACSASALSTCPHAVKKMTGRNWLAPLAFVAWSSGISPRSVSTTRAISGARVMGIRVVCARGDEPVGVKASIVRLVGMVLAAIPLCAAFLLILVDDRRRGLQDVLARTVVRTRPRRPGPADGLSLTVSARCAPARSFVTATPGDAVARALPGAVASGDSQRR